MKFISLLKRRRTISSSGLAAGENTESLLCIQLLDSMGWLAA